MKFHLFPQKFGTLWENQAAQSFFIAMEDITPIGWGDQFEDCKSFTSSITEQYQSPPSPKEVWDTLGKPSGKYDYMVKYSAPLSSQIAIEDITPTRWDNHFEDNMIFTSPVAPEEVWETPNNENDFLTQYTAPQNAQDSLEDIIPTGCDNLIGYLSQPTEVSQSGLSYPAEYLAH